MDPFSFGSDALFQIDGVSGMIGFFDPENFREIHDRCGKCRYCYRSVFSEPCKTGIHLICYSGTCAAYKPSLKTIVKDVIERIKE